MLILVLLAAVPALGLILYTGLEQRRGALAEIHAAALRLTKLATVAQTDALTEGRQLLSVLAHLPAVHTWQTTGCSELLAQVLRHSPRYINFGVLDTNGYVRCSALPFRPPVRANERKYFQQALQTGQFATGDYQVGKLTGKPSINLGYPLRDADSRVRGVVYAAIGLEWLNRLVANTLLPTGSTLLVIDSVGTILARHPDSEHWVGQKASNHPLLHSAQTRESGTFEADGLDGIARLYTFNTIRPEGTTSGDGLRLVIGIPREVALAEVKHALQRNLLLLAGVTLFLLAVAWVGSEVFVLRGLRALLTGVRRVAAGDFSAHHDLRQNVGEIGELAQAFDDMAQSLAQHRDAVQTQQQRIARLNRVHATLSSVNSAIVRIRDRDTLYRALCRLAIDVGRFRLACVLLLQRPEPALVPHSHAGDGSVILESLRLTPEARPTEPVVQALLAGETIVSNRLVADTRLATPMAAAIARGCRACALFPLRGGGEVVGALVLYADESDFFDTDEIKLLEEVAADTSLGLDLIDKEDELHHLSYYDALTGLPNRVLFADRLDQALARSRFHSRHVAVLIARLDRFKEINTFHGHQVGDTVLQGVGHRLAEVVRNGDTVARTGTSAFGLVLTDVGNPGDSAIVARKIMQSLERPLDIAGKELFISLRIGIAVAPNDGADAETLLRSADAALHLPQSEDGATYRFYTPEIDVNARKRMEIERELRHALNRDELALYYQPIVDLTTLTITGAEALLRWHNPTLGPVSPAQFIPAAEETGLIIPIGEWVLRTACAQARAWRAAGVPSRIAINASAIQLRQADFEERARVILEESGVNKGGLALTLEITESNVMENVQRSAERLDALRKRGLSISIDDFGTGYSSLSYLKRLPVDTLKIDISFIRDLTRGDDDIAIVRAIIALAHNLELHVIAEGVETVEQLTVLRELRCDAAQGFLFSPGVPAAAFEALYRDGVRLPASVTPA